MVKRLLVLLVLLAALPALAQTETVTITDTVYLPNGSTATAGSIVCELSGLGTTDSLLVQRPVLGRSSATINASGVYSLALTPTVLILPAGRYYTCRLTITAPIAWGPVSYRVTVPTLAAKWADLTVLNYAPGIVAGPHMGAVSSDPSGECTTADLPRYSSETGVLCRCLTGSWSCVLPMHRSTYDTGGTTGSPVDRARLATTATSATAATTATTASAVPVATTAPVTCDADHRGWTYSQSEYATATYRLCTCHQTGASTYAWRCAAQS